MEESSLCLNADGKEPIKKGMLWLFKSRGFIYCLKSMRRQEDLGHDTDGGLALAHEGRIALSIVTEGMEDRLGREGK